MTTVTRTRTESAALEVRAGGEIANLRRGTRIAPRILGFLADGSVRATFVATQAGPLAGDHDSTRIVVGPRATLVVAPVAATLALPGSERTLLTLDIVIRKGGRLVLDDAPLIVAAGAHVWRRSTIELQEGAVAAIRETVTLGRHGEPSGALDSTLRATLARTPLLHDRLCVERPDPHVALPPEHRAVTTLCLLGARPADHEPAPNADPDAELPTVLALAGPGALARSSGISGAFSSGLAELWRAWMAIATPGQRSL
jgi:urease accessory protein